MEPFLYNSCLGVKMSGNRVSDIIVIDELAIGSRPDCHYVIKKDCIVDVEGNPVHTLNNWNIDSFYYGYVKDGFGRVIDPSDSYEMRITLSGWHGYPLELKCVFWRNVDRNQIIKFFDEIFYTTKHYHSAFAYQLDRHHPVCERIEECHHPLSLKAYNGLRREFADFWSIYKKYREAVSCVVDFNPDNEGAISYYVGYLVDLLMEIEIEDELK